MQILNLLGGQSRHFIFFICIIAISVVNKEYAAGENKQKTPKSASVKRKSYNSYCGLYCLYTTMKLAGKEVDFLELVKPEYISSRKGSSLADLKKAAEDYGLYAVPVGKLTIHVLQAKPTGFTVTTRVDEETGEKVVEQIEHSNGTSAKPEFLMHYCVSMYFKNGGSSCYIISIGDYSAPSKKEDFENGLALLEKEDEPTLILLTDAVNLSETDYYDLCKQAMAQCEKLKDRFAILDVPGGEDEGKVNEFRNGIDMSGLMYAAAYVPYLKTSLIYQYKEDGIQIKGAEGEEDTTLDKIKSTKTALYKYCQNTPERLSNW